MSLPKTKNCLTPPAFLTLKLYLKVSSYPRLRA